MKREWNTAEVEVLSISRTANGTNPTDDYDDEWVQLPDGKWYLPGGGGVSPA